MSFEKSFTEVISIILTACVILASPCMALPQSTTSTTPPQASSATPSKALPPGGGPWPRPETYQGARISIYQPQIESWTGNKLDAYTSVAIMPKDSKAIAYGVIWFTARTEVDKVNRVVALDDFKLTKQNFPSLPSNGAAYSGAFRQSATWSQAMPLDELQSSLAVTPTAEKQQRVQVRNDPPTIFFSTAPAVLALID